ncbi:hypothetical protein UFOVP22_10 [uncultured Caudovirales phage]|uniref:Uncharacterized protein n=1 Tax=uncultured Caudovirales phage TaxID=2100421 RepID=A0A6J5TAD1_9CAUD|nr:hypothetical protein UFOVP22_10 [uncultured Caudovirales phage]
MQNIIDDYYLTNPTAPKGSFELLLDNSKVWEWEWGLILAYGNSVHIHILKEFRKKVFLKKYLKTVANEIFKIYPIIKTTVLKSKPTPISFNTKMGWVIVNETKNEWFLEMSQKDFKYGTN